MDGIPGCTNSEYKNDHGTKFYSITTRKSKYYDHEGWRNRILQVVSRYRFIGRAEKERVARGEFYICEKHYKEEDMEYLSKSFIYPYLLVFMYSICKGTINSTVHKHVVIFYVNISHFKCFVVCYDLFLSHLRCSNLQYFSRT